MIAGDELTTSIVTGQLGRNMDAAYTAGQQAVLATAPAERSRLLGSLYTSLLPAVDARLFTLEQLHAADPPAEHADIELFGRQWAAVRKLLSPADLPARHARRPRRARRWCGAGRRLRLGQRPPRPAVRTASSTTPAPTTRTPTRARSGPPP